MEDPLFERLLVGDCMRERVPDYWLRCSLLSGGMRWQSVQVRSTFCSCDNMVFLMTKYLTKQCGQCTLWYLPIHFSQSRHWFPS